MDALITMWLGGLVPPAVFLLILWLLLEPKCSKRTACWVLAVFWGVELAVQGAVYALGGSPELLFTLLPLTLYLPAILGAHLLSGRPVVPTAAAWLLALLGQHLLVAVAKLLTALLAHAGGWMDGRLWGWLFALTMLLGSAGLVWAVWRWLRQPLRAVAGELGRGWAPLLALPLMLLAVHSYFLSSTTDPAGLFLLLLTALAAFWVLARLMTALATERKARENNLEMAALKRDYALLQKKLELGRSYRHDSRHHMNALSALLRQGQTQAALDYVSNWQGQLTQIENRSWCKNAAVNAVLSAYLTQAEEALCAVEVQVSLPGELPVEELDLCVALANALENAIHACRDLPEEERRVKLELTLADHGRLTLHVENPCSGEVEIGPDGFPVKEPREGHGQGLKSIAAVAGKYHGMFQCDSREGVFSLWVVLLDAAPEPRRIHWVPVVCGGILLALFLLNCMPTLAHALEAVPGLGDVVRVVDLRSYAWFWGDTGVSVETPVLEGDRDAVDAVEAKREEFISQMKDAFLYHAARKHQGYVSQDVSYEVLRDDETLFILRFDAVLYAGNSVEYQRHVVLDQAAGRVLELSDLFLEDVNYAFPISREIKAQMEEQVKADIGDYFLPGGIWPEEECFRSIDPEEQDFYINEDGQLVIVFAEYEVAPGSMGTPEFVIPTEVLDGLLTQPSLLK